MHADEQQGPSCVGATGQSGRLESLKTQFRSRVEFLGARRDKGNHERTKRSRHGTETCSIPTTLSDYTGETSLASRTISSIGSIPIVSISVLTDKNAVAHFSVLAFDRLATLAVAFLLWLQREIRSRDFCSEIFRWKAGTNYIYIYGYIDN